MVKIPNNLVVYERKRGRNRVYIICISIVTIILISIALGIKALSVSAASAEEIKEMLIGESIYFNNKYIELNNENIDSIEIINRTTKKDKEDNVNIKIKIFEDLKSFYISSNIKLEYIDNNWVLQESNLDNVIDIEVNSNDEDIIINEIKKNGFKTISGNKYSSSTIKKVENLKFTQNNSDKNYLFTVEVLITNGVCYQKGKLSGQAIYDEYKEKYILDNIDLKGEGKVIKENTLDEERIKNIIMEEVTDNYTYSISNNDKINYYKIDKDNIEDFYIKQYVVKEDYTIRAEIDGKLQGNNQSIISFNGFVSISGNPLEGNIRNSRDIELEFKK